MSKYQRLIQQAVESFWLTKEKQGNVLAGKQLDAFLNLLATVSFDAGVPKECVFLKNNQVPGYYRATKDWDFLVVSPKGNLVAAVELKSQVGSYGNNLNNRTEESLGYSEDFWTAFREKAFPCKQSPWLGYIMVVGEDEGSTHPVSVSEPHFNVRPEFKNASYLERYKILCQRLVLEHKYNAVGLIATKNKNEYRSLAEEISIDSFIDSLRGHLLGLANEFK